MAFPESLSRPGHVGPRLAKDLAQIRRTIHAVLRRLLRLADEAVAHLAEAFDLGLHDVAGLEKSVGALADAAASAAAENIAALQAENVRGVFDLLLWRENELRSIAVLLELAVDGEPNEQILVIQHERARHQERPHRSEIVVAFAVEPIGAQARPVGADLQVARGDVVRRHEASDVIERVFGLDPLAA